MLVGKKYDLTHALLKSFLNTKSGKGKVLCVWTKKVEIYVSCEKPVFMERNGYKYLNRYVREGMESLPCCSTSKCVPLQKKNLKTIT